MEFILHAIIELSHLSFVLILMFFLVKKLIKRMSTFNNGSIQCNKVLRNYQTNHLKLTLNYTVCVANCWNIDPVYAANKYTMFDIFCFIIIEKIYWYLDFIDKFYTDI